jgi:hypothetical protein
MFSAGWRVWSERPRRLILGVMCRRQHDEAMKAMTTSDWQDVLTARVNSKPSWYTHAPRGRRWGWLMLVALQLVATASCLGDRTVATPSVGEGYVPIAEGVQLYYTISGHSPDAADEAGQSLAQPEILVGPAPQQKRRALGIQGLPGRRLVPLGTPERTGARGRRAAPHNP